ncbi:hypothetical protein [Gaoshiqia sp. Z1-71]|uniref:hypothetical protein n=1 Tax=Gaoshiqia hydrogeniformans TaxID=3290090 RepID=UPI003BF84902
MLKQVQHDCTSVMACRLAAAYGGFEPGKQGKGIGAGTGKRPCLRRYDELDHVAFPLGKTAPPGLSVIKTASLCGA